MAPFFSGSIRAINSRVEAMMADNGNLANSIRELKAANDNMAAEIETLKAAGGR